MILLRVFVAIVLCHLLVALPQQPSSFTAQAGVVAPLDDIFDGPIGTVVSCGGYMVGSFLASIDWGDTTNGTGEIVAPPYIGQLNGSHIFTGTAQAYTAHVTTTETCVNIAGSVGVTGPDSVGGQVPITVALASPPSTITLSSASVTGGSPITVSITIPNSTTSTRVWFGVSNPTVAAVEPSEVVIPAGHTVGWVTVTTKVPSPSPQNVTISAVSGGVSRSGTLRVN